ncbi:hypothetical protein IE987_29715 [Klebsiella pneumoniae]|uniref:Uncharacterized protein n=2 Tax=Klebsiella pneumoniae TaxID=573 RepID=A0A927HP83_KLEPN|nr:hypothetical protein [Klebsiella pneumoniae]MBD3715561.1 hypothetical protein [Klebsiella pneumoniae]
MTTGALRDLLKNMPEAYAARYGRERKRANGEVYIDKSGGSTYGHRECLLQLVNVKPDTLALNISSGTSKESNFLLALGLNPNTMIFIKSLSMTG